MAITLPLPSSSTSTTTTNNSNGMIDQVANPSTSSSPSTTTNTNNTQKSTFATTSTTRNPFSQFSPSLLLSLDAELSSIHPHAQLLVEEEALRILARSKRRKLDDIPSRERWRCPNEHCGREYKRTSTTSIGHHRETCPHRPILKARALYQVNPLLKAQWELQNMQTFNSHLLTSNSNAILVEQLNQLQQQQQLQQHTQQFTHLNAQSLQMSLLTASSSSLPQLSPPLPLPLPTPSTAHLNTPTANMMLNVPMLTSPTDFTSSVPSSFSTQQFSITSNNYLPLTTAQTPPSAFTPTNIQQSLVPNFRSNVSTPAVSNNVNSNQNTNTTTSATYIGTNTTSSNVFASPSSSKFSNEVPSSNTVMRPIARRHVDPMKMSSVILPSVTNESPRSLYFTAPVVSFPFQKIMNPMGEKQ